MRILLTIFALMMTVGAYAIPLTVKPEARARSFTIETDDGWIPAESPNTLKKREEGDPENFHPQTLGAFATYDRDAGVMVVTMKRLLPGKFEAVKLGSLDAMLERDTNGFTIHAGQGTTKLTISYKDGRNSFNKASHDALLQKITSSFRWTP